VKKNVFISHSSKDSITANKICEIFEKNGLDCWIAPRNVRPSFDYDEEILDGIEQSAAFVLLLSNNSNISRHVKRELELAQGKHIFPIRIQDVEPGKKLKYFLSLKHWTDAIEPPLETKLSAIIETIKSLTGLDTLDRIQKKEKLDLKENYKKQKGDGIRTVDKTKLESTSPTEEKLSTDPLRTHKGEINLAKGFSYSGVILEEYNGQSWYSYATTSKASMKANFENVSELPETFNICFQYATLNSKRVSLEMWIGSNESYIKIFDPSVEVKRFLELSKIYKIEITVKKETITILLDNKIFLNENRVLGRKPYLTIAFSTNEDGSVYINDIRIIGK